MEDKQNMRLAFNKNEKWFRKLYYQEKGKFLKTPMTYLEYQNIMEENPGYLDFREEYHMPMNTDWEHYWMLNQQKMPDDCCKIGMYRHDRYGYMIMHIQEYFEAVYVYRGECTHYIGEQILQMREGDFYFLAPNALHCLDVANDEAVVFSVLLDRQLFQEEFSMLMQEDNIFSIFVKTMKQGERAYPYIFFKTFEDQEVGELILKMYDEMQAHRLEKYHTENMLLTFMMIMIRLLRMSGQVAQLSDPLIMNRVDNHIISILAYLEIHYASATLRSTSKFFGFNETYLSMLLKRRTGRTFSVILSEIQMKNAKRLLKDKHLTLGEVAQEVGCFDSSHFVHKFKRVYGMTPKQYRDSLL